MPDVPNDGEMDSFVKIFNIIKPLPLLSSWRVTIRSNIYFDTLNSVYYILYTNLYTKNRYYNIILSLNLTISSN